MAPKVRVGLGVKLNIGNYQNVDLRVEVEDEQRDSEPSVKVTTDRLYLFCESVIDEKIDEYVNKIKSKNWH